MKKIALLAVLQLSFQGLIAQNFSPALSVPVTISGIQLVNPWAGGLNEPQFSVIDLNSDGIKDLFVLDPSGKRITTYINNGTPNAVDYHYAPQYISKFPELHDWALLVDYNCDGKEDIFTYNYSGGVTAYKNISNINGLLFTMDYYNVMSVYFGFPALLYVGSVYLPAITDVDSDGDLDFLVHTFSNNYVEYHQNFAMDSLGICDTLLFSLQPNCWGNFLLNGFNNTATLNAGCRTKNYNMGDDWNKAVLGNSRALLAFDMDGDMDKDLLTGGLLYQNLLQLTNGGTPVAANMISQDSAFPSYNVPANMNMYPSPFYFDADNDNRSDLIVSPGLVSNGEDIFNNLFYKNISVSNVDTFSLVTNNLFTKEMIDVGTNANVHFFDVDNDGLKDILVGNRSRNSIVGSDSSFIYYYRNNGTSANPSFEFITSDFFNTALSGTANLTPTFGDLDGDGDDDMLIGINDGTLIHYTNTAGPSFPANFVFTATFYQNIDVNSFAAPQLFDVNQDGKIDLLIGDKLGKIVYFENTGTTSIPAFTFVTNFLGEVNVTDTLTNIYGYSYPFMYNNNGNLEFLVGSERGWIYRYGNISGNLAGIFTSLDSIYGNIKEPKYSTVSGTDINGDGLMDLLIGNFAGGATLYSQLPTSVEQNFSVKNNIIIFPNPNNGVFTVQFLSSEISQITIQIINTLGQQVFKEKRKLTTGINKINITQSNLENGIYFLTIKSDNDLFQSKLILQK